MGFIVFLVVCVLLFMLVRTPSKQSTAQNCGQKHPQEPKTTTPKRQYDPQNPLDIVRAFSCLAANADDSRVTVNLLQDYDERYMKLFSIHVFVGPFCGSKDGCEEFLRNLDRYSWCIPADIVVFLKKLPVKASGLLISYENPNQNQRYSLNFGGEVWEAMEEGIEIGERASVCDKNIEREETGFHHDIVRVHLKVGNAP